MGSIETLLSRSAMHKERQEGTCLVACFRRLGQGLGAACLVTFLLLLVVEMVTTNQHYPYLLLEFDAILVPPASAVIDRTEVRNHGRIIITRYYRTPVSFSEIRRLYGHELRANSWQELAGGADQGATYCKGEYQADLWPHDVRSGSDWTYSLRLTQGGLATACNHGQSPPVRSAAMVAMAAAYGCFFLWAGVTAVTSPRSLAEMGGAWWGRAVHMQNQRIQGRIGIIWTRVWGVLVLFIIAFLIGLALTSKR